MHSIGLGGLFIAICTAAYWPALRAGFLWDDAEYITENPAVQSSAGLKRIWFEPGATPQYYPIVFTSFWLEWRLWDARPLGYHFVNVALHAVAAVLFWRVLVRLWVPGAWFAAFLFAVHPVMVETVAWVAELKNVLSTCLYIASVLCFLNYYPLPHDRISKRSWTWYVLALLAFVASLLAKTVTCTLPAVLLVLIWWKRGRLVARDLLVVLPFVVVAAIAGLGTVWLESRYIPLSHPASALSVFDRILIASRAIWFYLGKLVFPTNLAFIYPRWIPSPEDITQWLPLAAIIAALVSLYLMRNRVGRGPFAAASCYVISLLPVLGFVNIAFMQFSFVADHFQYLASLCVFAAMGAGAAAVLGLLRPFGRRIGYAIAALVLLVLGVKTNNQCRAYADQRELFSQTLRVNPQSAFAHSAYGYALQQKGQFAEAMSQYDQALLAIPLERTAIYNLGGVARAMDRIPEAIQILDRCERLEPRNEHVKYMLATAFAWSGRTEDAIKKYEETVSLQPRFAGAYNNLGSLLIQRGRIDDAIAALRRATSLAPEFVEARLQLGAALESDGNLGEAVIEYEAAVRLRPDDLPARMTLASALGRLGRYIESKQCLIAAREIAARSSKWQLVAEIDDSLRNLDAAIAAPSSS